MSDRNTCHGCHHPTCNFSPRPIHGNGCVCEVVNRYEQERVAARLSALESVAAAARKAWDVRKFEPDLTYNRNWVLIGERQAYDLRDALIILDKERGA
jgi:hypothetical protein